MIGRLATHNTELELLVVAQLKYLLVEPTLNRKSHSFPPAPGLF